MRILLGCVLLSLAGCGFHLRTFDVDESVDGVAVSSTAGHVLASDLTNALRQAGVSATSRQAEAAPEVTIELLGQRRNRRSVSVTSQARVAEYEMSLEIEYAIRHRDGRVLVPAVWIGSERVYQVDRNNILGSSEEQALLERELRDDLLRQVLTALNAVLRAPA